jgi:hypothetical protein
MVIKKGQAAPRDTWHRELLPGEAGGGGAGGEAETDALMLSWMAASSSCCSVIPAGCSCSHSADIRSACPHPHACQDMCMLVCMHACMHACIHASHTLPHTRSPTHTHSHAHTRSLATLAAHAAGCTVHSALRILTGQVRFPAATSSSSSSSSPSAHRHRLTRRGRAQPSGTGRA